MVLPPRTIPDVDDSSLIALEFENEIVDDVADLWRQREQSAIFLSHDCCLVGDGKWCVERILRPSKDVA